MKVLLTGGTGFLGSEIARELLCHGHHVRILVRRSSSLDALKGAAVERAYGDLLDRRSIVLALDGVDAVIHTAANVSMRVRDKDLVFRVNVEGTRNVLRAAHQGRVPRVVYTSSIVAVGSTAEPMVLTEESPWNGGVLGHHYVEAKRQSENVALEMARQGLGVVILNPGVILGAGDPYISSTRYVLEYLRGRNRFYFGPGGNSYCHVRDVARAHVAALSRGRTGERYLLTGHSLSQRDALDALWRVTRLCQPRWLPYPVAWLGALLSEGVAKVRSHEMEEFNRPVLRLSMRYCFTDCSKAVHELGYEVTPFEDTLREAIRDLLLRGLAPARTPGLCAIVAG